MIPKDYEILKKSHNLARELQCEAYNLHYRKALSKALKIVWNTFKRLNEASTAFSQDEKQAILSDVKQDNKYSWSLVLYYNNHSALIEKVVNYAYKEWSFYHKDKGHSLYFSTEFINQIKY